MLGSVGNALTGRASEVLDRQFVGLVQCAEEAQAGGVAEESEPSRGGIEEGFRKER